MINRSAIKSLVASSLESPQASLVWPTAAPEAKAAAEEVAYPPSGALPNASKGGRPPRHPGISICKSNIERKPRHTHNPDEHRNERYPTEALKDEEVMGDARRLRQIKRRLFLAAVDSDQSLGIQSSNNAVLRMSKETASSNKLPSWEMNQSLVHLNQRCKSVSARCA